ncbi:glycoside hydrolase family 5 protein [Roseburia faecis]|uniref:glycoside hydrolase family 5 protein n=1 Tax=Roseburia faecis TaxID=301302 RepID=UPI00189A4A5C|nr:glycoside hydrolase family 5 protein [Roseburia faecis]MED9950460.1 glycoside hydrolase family 5 protein [Roseburia faecis]
MYFFNKKIKILRGFALVCVLALGLCLTGGLQIAEAKTTTYYDASAGRLHVKGTKLVDKKGHEVQLRGVSTHGLSWYPQYVNDKCFAQLHDQWGANVVRLAMYTEEYNGYCSGDAKNRSDLKKRIKKGVRLAKKHKMYVIVDWHILSDGNPNSHKKEAKAFFREMSREFKGYNNVIYEICNEPNNGTSWKEIKSYARSVISTIRKNDKKAVIVVGTPTWSQDVDQAAADPIKGDNIMYALHFYAATHKTDLRNKMTAAINKGLPVFVTEYGICDASGNGAIDKKEADRWIQTMDEYGVSYIAWNLSNKQESSSIIKSSCSKVSGFKKSDLSDEGKWLYSMLRKKAGLTK